MTLDELKALLRNPKNARMLREALANLASHGLSVSDAVEKKYNPDQPRDPAGTATGGQWTAAGGGGAASAPAQGSVQLSGPVDDFLQKWTSTGQKDDTLKERLVKLLAKPGFNVTVDLRYMPDSTRATISAGYQSVDGLHVGNWIIDFQRMPDGSIVATPDLPLFFPTEQPIKPGASYFDKEMFGRFEKIRSEFGWLNEVEFQHSSPGVLQEAEALMPKVETDSLRTFFGPREQSISAELLTSSQDPDYENKNVTARKDVKAAGANALAAAGMNRADAEDLQSTWAGSSNDHGNEWQDFLQLETLSRSERQDAFSVGTGTVLAATRANKDEDNALNMRYGASIAYDSIYDRTQNFLREHGIGPDDEIVLYRGMTVGNLDAVKVSSPLNVRPRPLSSFSLDFDEASAFAVRENGSIGVVVAARVPAKAIFSHWSTGFGCMGENECIVLGEYLLDKPWIVLERFD